MKPVLTKSDFVRRYQNDEFGNRAPTWNTLKDFFEDTDLYHLVGTSTSRLFHLRNRIKGGKTLYNLSYRTLCTQAFGDKGNFYVSEMAPTKKTLIQGEVWRAPGGLHLIYSLETAPMREALAMWNDTVNGLAASLLLQEYMDSNSWGWLNELLDNYDDHVVEFSTYSTCWGTVKGFNTVFWEVRRY